MKLCQPELSAAASWHDHDCGFSGFTNSPSLHCRAVAYPTAGTQILCSPSGLRPSSALDASTGSQVPPV